MHGPQNIKLKYTTFCPFMWYERFSKQASIAIIPLNNLKPQKLSLFTEKKIVVFLSS